MKHPIPGVFPPDLEEVKVMTVWPTIGATAAGRWVGRMADVRLGLGEFFTLGKLLALATIPVSLAVFVWQLMPYVCRRYCLTNRRLIVRRGLSPTDERWISLDEFDAIETEVLPGQEWLHCGDLIFKRGTSNLLRLPGVSRPEAFRQVCLKTQVALLSVREVFRQEAARAVSGRQ